MWPWKKRGMQSGIEKKLALIVNPGQRAVLEKAILEGLDIPPSGGWLGLHSPNDRIRRSGLWNLDHLDFHYEHAFLARLEQYVDSMNREYRS